MVSKFIEFVVHRAKGANDTGGRLVRIEVRDFTTKETLGEFPAFDLEAKANDANGFFPDFTFTVPSRHVRWNDGG